MSYKINEKCIGCTACAKVCPVNAISGETKIKHVINEKICIECGLCGKTCRFDSISDPEGKACVPVEKALWTQPFFDLQECCGCRQCELTCPVSCISTKTQVKGSGTLYPLLDERECISCGRCEQYCPVDAIQMK